MLWQPLTCKCEVAVDMFSTTMNHVRTISTCPRHTHLAGQALVDRVLSESILQTDALGLEFKKLAKFTEPTFDDDGVQDGARIKDGVITWSFDMDGNMTLRTSISLTNAERNNITKALNTRFGGKVILL